MVVVWSERAARSEWVQREASVGLDARRLVMVRIDPAQAPAVYREGHLVDLTGWHGDAEDVRLRSIVDWIQTLVAGLSPAEAPTASVHLDLDEFSATVRGIRGGADRSCHFFFHRARSSGGAIPSTPVD